MDDGSTTALDALSGEERERLLATGRPRRALPRFEASRVTLPLAPTARPVDVADRPIYVVWELTLRCDLACRHCGSRAGTARPDELTRDEALALVVELAGLGVREVTLIGGEVYLYPAWLDVIRAIRENGMACSVVSGGRQLTRERAAAAKHAGVQSIAVSIDGDAVTHDRLRGLEGSHRAALAALGAVRDAGLPVAVNTQINRLSLPHLPEVFEVVRGAGAHGWQLQLTVPAGRAADEPEILLQPYDLLALFPLLARLKKSCDELGITFLPGNNVGYFGPHDHELRRLASCGHSASCPAGRLGLGIEANGDIKGCPSLPSDAWVGGNVREHPLQAIWERSAPLRYNRDRSVDDLWGYCRSCYYADECRAGCTWMSSSLFGRPGNNPYCHHRALELDRQGLRERVEPIAAAPGTPFDHGIYELLLETRDGTEVSHPHEEKPACPT